MRVFYNHRLLTNEVYLYQRQIPKFCGVCVTSVWSRSLRMWCQRQATPGWLLHSTSKTCSPPEVRLPPLIRRSRETTRSSAAINHTLTESYSMDRTHASERRYTVLREVLSYVPENGRRSRGRPRLRYFDTLKADLVERNTTNSNIKQDDFWKLVAEKAADRTSWRRIVNWRR